MATVNMQQTIDFINTVQLRIPDLSAMGLTGANAGTDTEADAASANGASAKDGGNGHADIAAGSLISFVAGISDQVRQDVLDSTLFAQFAANAQYDRETQANQWYSTYLSTLGGIAWTVQGFDFQQYKVSSSSFKLDEVVLDIMKSAFTADEYAIVKASIEALKKLKDDDDRIKLFGHSAVKSNAGNFQIGAVTETNGAVALHTLGAYFTSTDSNTDFLFVHYKGSSTQIYKGVQSMTLNEAQYANIRNAIANRLGKNTKDFVMSVPISAT